MTTVNKMSPMELTSLTEKLVNDDKVVFYYNEHVYEIFHTDTDTSSDNTTEVYVINIYNSCEQDESGCYLDRNMVDGGVCTGKPSEAILFMLHGTTHEA